MTTRSSNYHSISREISGYPNDVETLKCIGDQNFVRRKNGLDVLVTNLIIALNTCIEEVAALQYEQWKAKTMTINTDVHRTLSENGNIVVGVDVGGIRKGFHAVALQNGKYESHTNSHSVNQIVAWCHKIGASHIAIDAPCRWSNDGKTRPAERALMEIGVWCFSSPTREQALSHPSNYYGWMLQGERLYQELSLTHPLAIGLPEKGKCVSFETFPHAIAWHLTDGKALASKKRSERRAILDRAEIDRSMLTNIDLVDAALCAMLAHRVANGFKCSIFGEVETGYIIVPARMKSIM